MYINVNAMFDVIVEDKALILTYSDTTLVILLIKEACNAI